MKKIIIIGFLVGSIFLSACSSAEKNSQNSESALGSSQDQGENVDSSLENTYPLSFIGAGKEYLSITHTSGEDTYVSFTNSGTTSLQVSISFPDGNGNLRLSQITMPDGEMDGPFGIDTDYTLTQEGKYLLRFGENMMAGDPWSGNALIAITLK